ncbi:MAG: hypothetical protein FJ276_15575, partial [Planctomycetes bacterium]|nr:hypothetical protein [Planctomycetota bacterium]
MCNERHGLLLVVAVTWGAATAGLCAEDADRFRVFTDRDDHRAEARLTNFNQQTGVVTLRSREGKSGQFPLLSFSAHDQDYIRARFVPRSWTSVDGRTTSPLAYGGIEGSVVMLVPKTGKTLRTEFSNLSPIDQAFLRRIDPDAAPALPEADGDMGTDPPPKTGTASEEPSRPNPNLVQKYAEQRTWTIDGNRSLDARFVARQNGTVVLELPDGPKRSISASSLSAADADYIQDFEAKIRALTQHHPCQSAAIRVSARDGQQSPARQVHLSSDGTRLAVTYGDYEVRGLRYFDAAKGTVLGAHELPERVRHLDGGRQAFTFVGSGDAIALATVEEIRGPQSLEVYGVAVMSLNGIVQRSSPRIGTTARHNRSALKLSPEGRQLAFAYHVSNSDRTTSVEVAILDTASLERLQALTAPVSGSSGTGTGPSLTFSPDGR